MKELLNYEIIEELEGWIEDIKADERYNYPPAKVEINAPLALIQNGMEAQVEAYRRVIVMLGNDRLSREKEVEE